MKLGIIRKIGIPMLVTVAACQSAPPVPTYNFIGTSAAPAAEGAAVVRKEVNGNSQVSVTVRHLAPPGRLQAGSTAYVVWVTPLDNGAPQNVGVLKLDAALTGTLNTVTPFQEFKLTIGPEADPMIQAPTTEPVIVSMIRR
jgi:hypothetical protein